VRGLPGGVGPLGIPGDPGEGGVNTKGVKGDRGIPGRPGIEVSCNTFIQKCFAHILLIMLKVLNSIQLDSEGL
jgi:hypothetical protein